MTTESHLVLRRGRDLTAWPWIKLRMAQAQIDELSANIDVWNLEHTFVATPQLSDDRHVVQLRVTEAPTPPLTFWSALLGNAIASLRAAADSFAWQIAHLSGNEPPNPKNVYFPTASKSNEWRNRIRALGDLHPDLSQRFEDLRVSSDGNWLSAIVAIAELNNIDKHRSALRVSPRFEKASIDSLTIDFPQGHGGMKMNFEPVVDLQTVNVGDAAARLRFSGPVNSAVGTLNGTLLPVLSVGDPSNKGVHGCAVTLACGMHDALAYGLEYLCYGDPATHSQDAESLDGS